MQQTSDAIFSRKQALRSASTAGLAMAIAAFLPIFIKLFPIWMLAGGWLAVVLYRRRARPLLVSSTTGGKLGALAGFLAFLFLTVFISAYLTIATVVLHHGEEIRATLRAALQQAATTNQDPRAQLLVQWGQTPEGLAMLVAFSMFVFLVAFLLFSTAGGIFAAVLSRRKLR